MTEEIISSTLSKLRPYQLTGVEWLADHKRTILGDDMGIGKTVQALVAGTSQYKTGLIICPNSVKEVWASEIDKWCPHIKYQVLDTKHKKINPNADWIIVNYDLVKVYESHKEGVAPRSADLFWEIVFHKWGVVIYDEAHMLKNRKSAAFHAAKSLCKTNKDCALYLLTGTPLMNSATEFWSYLHLIDPKAFSSYWRWVEDHFNKTETIFSKYNVTDLRDPENLKQEMSKYMLRREKKDVLTDLPDKVYQDITVEMSSHQQSAYNSMKKRMTYEGKDALNAVSQLTYLREICISDALVSGKEGLPGAKLDAILDILNGTDQKVLIFSQFTKAIKGLEYEFKKRDITYGRLIGDDSGQQRAAAVTDFQNNPNTRAFLCNTIAGGVGITLTAATIVICLDLMWTPSMNAQAIDRAHRIGQKDTVTVITLTCKDTVEALVWETLDNKQDIFDATVPTIDPNVIIRKGLDR